MSIARRVMPVLALFALAKPLAAQVKISGYGEASYTYANNPVGDVIVGRLYDRFANQFMLNGLKLVFERAAATDKWDAGVRADFVFGQNATVIQAAGLSLGPSADLTQMFVTLNMPTGNGNGFQIRVGKLVTLMGLELIETPFNPNLSMGNQFIYVENFTNTGLELAHRFSPALDVQFRVGNGWDRVQATDGNMDVMARVGITGGKTSVGIVGYSGAMNAGSDAKRTGVSVLLNQKLGKASLWVQGDYGNEEAVPEDFSWMAIGAWLALDLNAKTGLAFRADYLSDPDAFRTGGAFGATGEHNLMSFTGTLNLKTWPNALVRPELRFDSSNQAVFNGEESQFTLGLGVAYIF
jgi:putative OmpL-like beta-barrel porin-2